MKRTLALEEIPQDVLDKSAAWQAKRRGLNGSIAFLIGVGVDKGLIDIGKPVSSYIGGGWTKATPEQEAAITIRHMLSMTSGQDFRGLALRGVAGDQFAINAAAPQAVPPGTLWA